MSGGSAIGYQWYFLPDLTVKPLVGTPRAGATSPLLNIPVVTANDEGFYYCVAFDPATGYARRSHYVQLTPLTTRIVHLPVIRPGSRSFVGPFDVQITCATPGAAILYLLDDGRSPAAWKVYDPNAPLTIDRRCVLRAYAVKRGFNPSKEVRAGYVDDATDDVPPGQNLGQLTGNREVTKDGVGVLTDGRSVLSRDAVDFYTFMLATERKVFLSVSDAPVTSRFSVELLSEAGARQGYFRGGSPALIIKTLPAGMYRVKIALSGDTQLNAPYVLTITDQAPGETKWAVVTRKRKVQHIALMDALTAAPIVAGKPAWLVIHGRTSRPSASNIRNLVEALDGYEAGKQIIAIDWETAAADNNPAEATVFTADGEGEGRPIVAGARWIGQVGRAAAAMLKAKGITATQLDIAGHSWGTFVGHEVAAQFNSGSQRIPRFIALDPASFGAGYTTAKGGLKFATAARYSIAFYGEPQDRLLDGSPRDRAAALAFIVYGSPKFAVTARDAFTMVGDDWGLLDAHTEPVNIFAAILAQLKAGNPDSWMQRFSLSQFSQLAAGALPPWAVNVFNKDGEPKPAGFNDKKGEYLFEGAFAIEGKDTIDQYP
ncbi:MAG: chitobiase/beta-hexosaminidase C-terminal domain-containing protein [Chthoniobacteraceae bacterium]